MQNVVNVNNRMTSGANNNWNHSEVTVMYMSQNINICRVFFFYLSALLY